MISALTSIIPSFFAILVLVPVCVLFYVVVFNNLKAGLSEIPGPFLARDTDAWRLYVAWRYAGHENELYSSLKEQYGDVIRMGPKAVTVLDPRAVPVIYGVKSRLAKGDAYLPFRPPGVTTSLLSIQDEEMHGKYRRPVANAYSMSSIKGYEPYVDDMINRLVKILDRHEARRETINISRWCHYFAFDVVGKITFGASVGFLEGKDAFDLISLVSRLTEYVRLVSQMPWLDKVFRDNLVMTVSKPSPFLKLVHGKVQERLRNPDPEDARPDLLSRFVASQKKHPEIMTDRQVAIVTSSNLVAGALSPSRVLDTMFHFLTTHPEAQKRLYAEVTNAGCTYPVSLEQADRLPYLEGVIREALRTHSLASFNLERVTGPSGLDLPSSHRIPPGIAIGVNSGAMNMNKEIFGADATEYKPERWMRAKTESEEAFTERRRAMDLTEMTFGQGSRTCIGKNIVHMELFKVMATLIGLFQFELAEKPERSKVVVKVHHRR